LKQVCKHRLYRNGPCLWFLCLFIASFQLLSAQQQHKPFFLDIEGYGIKDGILHQHVYQTYQDNRGIIWLVTANGLNVFDGEAFYMAMEWPLPASHLEISIRAEDAVGRLWVRFKERASYVFRLVNIYTREIEDIKSALDASKTGMPVDVAFDAFNRMLLINEAGELWRRDTADRWGKIAVGFDRTWDFCAPTMPERVIWLHKWEDETMPGLNMFLALDMDGRLISKTTIELTGLFGLGRNNSIWVRSNEKVAIIQADGKISWVDVSRYLPEIKEVVRENKPSTLAYDRAEGYLWVQLVNRAYIIDPHIGVLHAPERRSTAALLSPSNYHVFIDRQQNVWFGSVEGVSLVRRIPQRFKQLHWVDTRLQASYDMKEARGIAEGEDGTIYMQCGNSVYAYDPRTLEMTIVHRQKQNISSISCDPLDGTLWFLYNQLIRYSPKNGQLKRFPQSEWFGNSFNWSILIQPRNIILGNSDGLFVFDKESGDVTPFEAYNGFDALRSAEVYCARLEHPEEIWLLTNKGLFVMHPEAGVRGHYGSDKGSTRYLPVDNLRHYYKDEAGVYWFATAQGLLRWEPDKGEYRLYTTSDGLSNNNLYAVYPDDFGFLWLSSDQGIIQFHPETGSARYYLVEDGITNNEFNRISHAKGRDGTIYFGGLNGVTTFHPRDFRYEIEKEADLPVVLMAVEIMGENKFRGRDLLIEYNQTNKLVLLPTDRFVNLRFAMPNYKKTKGVVYSYRIEGLDTAWINTNSPVIQLLGLRSGNYTLVINAKTGDGPYSGNASRIPIQVMPPVYLRPWFWALIALSVSVVVAIGVYYRVNLLKQRQIELERLVVKSTQKIRKDKEVIEQQAHQLEHQQEEKNRFFSNVTHEFRTPISLILGPLNVIRDHPRLNDRAKNLLGIAHRNAIHLLDMVDDILMLSVLETHAIKPRDESVSPRHFLGSIADEHAVVAAQKSIDFRWETTFPETYFMKTDVKLLRIILNNILSNAFKYTPVGGQVRFFSELDNGLLRVMISDTGRGIHADDLPHIFERFYQTKMPRAVAEGGNGIGLALSYELTQLMGGALSVESRLNEGTTFSIELPAIPELSPSSFILPFIAPKTGRARAPKRTDLTILIVEDNLDYQQYLRHLLDEYYQVFIAGNGAEAMGMLRSGLRPSYILADMMMPEMDGFQLLSNVKGLPEMALVPFVFLTARSGREDGLRALQSGADDYLVKPFDERSLFATMDSLIKRYREKQAAHEEVGAGRRHPATSESLEWVRGLKQAVEQHMEDQAFGVDQLAKIMLMGRSSFFAEVRRLTGLTPNQFVLEARLLRARYLMETQPELSLRKIIQRVGLKDEGHFVKSFKKRFGNSPTYYM